jgi:hypothetical protein
MSTIRQERETTIAFNEEDADALVWSASPIFQRKMERLGIAYYKSSEGEGAGVDESRYYRVPKKLVSVRQPRKLPELTEEQRHARAILTRARFTKRATPEIPDSSSGEK